MSATAPQTLTAADFLAAAFGRCEAGYLTLFNAADDTSHRFAIDGGIDDAASFIGGKKNIYVNVGVLDELLPSYRRGKKQDVRRVPFLWTDLDLSKSGAKKKYPTREHALAALDEMGLPPSLRVSSGRGFYPLWFFNEPVELRDLNAAIQFEQELSWPLQQQLRQKLHRYDKDYALDSTHDVSRMIRVVGSLHSSGAAVQAEVPHGGINYYDRADVEALLTAITGGYKTPWSGKNGRASVQVCDLFFNPEVSVPEETLEFLLGYEEEFRRTWQRRRDDLRDKSPSGYSYSLTNTGVGLEWSDQQIADMVIHWRRLHNELADTAGEVIRKIRFDISKVRGEREAKADETANDLRSPQDDAGAPAHDADSADRPNQRTKSKKIKVTAARLAGVITARDHFARDAGNLLYVYQGGVYVPRGERHVKAEVKKILARARQSDEWRRRLGEEVTEYITVDAPELWEQRHDCLLNLKNGLLDIGKRRLMPHSPEHLSPVQLPIVFDPKAKCEFSEKCYADWFPADSLMLPWEIAAFAISPNKNIQKAVLLLGEGENGKSRYLAQLSAFIGRKNVTAMPLHKLESDKFAVARLVGKLANICADLPSRDLNGTSVFKALTGDDFSFTAERKFKESFEFEPYCRLLFSANHPPHSDDASKAFFRRWLPVPFERVITPGQKIEAKRLDAMLAAPAELSGLLNRALDALPALEQRRDFTKTESVNRTLEDFQATTDPLRIWLETHTQFQPHGHVVKTCLTAAYNAWANEHGKANMSPHAVTAAVKKIYPDVQEAQREGKQWAWLGVGLVTERYHK